MDNTRRLQLKNQALLEKVSSLTANYENQVADLRVELTLVSEELQALRDEQQAKLDETQEEPVDDVALEEDSSAEDTTD
jgi:hypothetical protein